MTKRNKNRAKEKPHPNDDSGGDDTPTNIHVRGEIEIARSSSLVDEHNAERKADATQAEKRYSLEKLTLIALAVYTGITLILAVMNGIVISDSRKHFVKDQRPYIWLTNNLGAPDFLRPPGSTDQKGYVAWAWHYTNYGKTPASQVTLNEGMQIGDNALSKPRTFDGPDHVLPPLPPTKDDFSSAFFKDKVSLEEFHRLMTTEETIVVYGHFTYTDASGKGYETGFCIYHLMLGPIAYCPDSTSNYIR
jgi:hypothetical protein